MENIMKWWSAGNFMSQLQMKDWMVFCGLREFCHPWVHCRRRFQNPTGAAQKMSDGQSEHNAAFLNSWKTDFWDMRFPPSSGYETVIIVGCSLTKPRQKQLVAVWIAPLYTLLWKCNHQPQSQSLCCFFHAGKKMWQFCRIASSHNYCRYWLKLHYSFEFQFSWGISLCGICWRIYPKGLEQTLVVCEWPTSSRNCYSDLGRVSERHGVYSTFPSPATFSKCPLKINQGMQGMFLL